MPARTLRAVRLVALGCATELRAQEVSVGRADRARSGDRKPTASRRAGLSPSRYLRALALAAEPDNVWALSCEFDQARAHRPRLEFVSSSALLSCGRVSWRREVGSGRPRIWRPCLRSWGSERAEATEAFDCADRCGARRRGSAPNILSQPTSKRAPTGGLGEGPRFALEPHGLAPLFASGPWPITC